MDSPKIHEANTEPASEKEGSNLFFCIFSGKGSLVFLEILPTALMLWNLQNQPSKNGTTVLKRTTFYKATFPPLNKFYY